MRMTVRRYRRRRTGSDSLGFAHSHFSSPFFDRLVYLSQSINQTRKTDAPFIILVTRDSFLRTGFQRGPSPLNNCCDYDTLIPAISALEHWPTAKLVIDIDSRAAPLIEMLDTLRRLILYPPFTSINLLIRADDYDTRLFCKTTGPFEVFERQLSAKTLQQALLDPPARNTNRHDWFSKDEWAILQKLSQGESLKHIALLHQRPYSRIVYRVGRIVDKLGLHHRQELIHLLHRLLSSTDNITL